MWEHPSHLSLQNQQTIPPEKTYQTHPPHKTDNLSNSMALPITIPRYSFHKLTANISNTDI